MLEEERGELKDLANKEPDEELELADADDLGREIANIEDEEERKRFLSMVKALGSYYPGSNPETQEKMETIRTDAISAYKEEREDIEEESTYKRLIKKFLI